MKTDIALGKNEAADKWLQHTEIRKGGSVVDFVDAECDIADGSIDAIFDAIEKFRGKYGLSQPPEAILDAVSGNDRWSDGTFEITTKRRLLEDSEPA